MNAILELVGPSDVQTECFLPISDEPDDPAPYVDPGATAHDQCQGDRSQQIITYGEILKSQPGIYSIEYQVRDSAFNQADPVVRNVEVADTLPPTVTVSPPIRLWPPSGQMYAIDLSQCARARDRCEGNLNINDRGTITSATSNEPDDDEGDIIISGNGTVLVRAERNGGGSGRIYTVDFSVSDSTGNVTQSQCTIHVPHNAAGSHR